MSMRGTSRRGSRSNGTRVRGGSMARPLNDGYRRRRKPRKIGRKILFVLALGIGIWYGYTDLWPVVRNWVGFAPDLPPVDSTLTEQAGQDSLGISVDSIHVDSSQRPPDRPRVDLAGESRRSAAEAMDDSQAMAAVDTVSQANFGERFLEWLGERLAQAFHVREIKLDGERTLSRHALMDGLDSLRGQPLLPLDPPSLAESLRSNPRVRSASIRKQLPGTVSVMIEERREQALILQDGDLWGLDNENVVLPLPEGSWPLDLPVVTGLADSLAPGRQLHGPAIMEVSRWVNEITAQSRVHAWLSEIRVDAGNVVCLIGRDGRTVLPGAHSVTAQVATLDALLGEEDGHPNGKLIDLSFPEYLIVRDEPWSRDPNTSTGG